MLISFYVFNNYRPIISKLLNQNMGNKPICSSEAFYKWAAESQNQLRNSTSIHIVGDIPVITGAPLNFHKQQTFNKVQDSAMEFCQGNPQQQFIVNDLEISYANIIVRIIAYGHTDIFKAYEQLPLENQEAFLQSIKNIDFDFLDSLHHNYMIKSQQIPLELRKPHHVIPKKSIQDKQKYIQIGINLIRARQVGFLIMCAGSSSRFRFQDKFLLPLQLRSGRSLLEVMLGRIRNNFRIRQGEIANIPIIIACNEQNIETIKNFLEEKKFCGFEDSKIKFMVVTQLPILNQHGHVCLSFQYKLLERPGGTAKCIEEMFNNPKFYNFLKKENIQFLEVIGCENLSENPGDPFTLGYLKKNNLDLIGKCVNAEQYNEDFPRLVGTANKKNLLFGPQEIMGSKIGEDKAKEILSESPILLNFLAFKIDNFKTLIKDFQNSLFLSYKFRTIEGKANYFDFQKQKPELNEPVITFQKDLGHFFTCTKKGHIIHLPRDHFMPIITKNKQYSIQQICKNFQKSQDKAYSRSTLSKQSSQGY